MGFIYIQKNVTRQEMNGLTKNWVYVDRSKRLTYNEILETFMLSSDSNYNLFRTKIDVVDSSGFVVYFFSQMYR